MRRTKSPRVTPEMAAHIRFLMAAKRLYQHQVAALLGINQGRVSEVLNGHLHPGVAPAKGPFPS